MWIIYGHQPTNSSQDDVVSKQSRVLGFLRKRSNNGRDRSKSMVIPQVTDSGSRLVNPDCNTQDLTQPQSHYNTSQEHQRRRTIRDDIPTSERRPTLAATLSRRDSLELSRSDTPTGRRPAFSVALPWRPQSEHFSSNTSSNPHTKYTKAQLKFIRAFPELADMITVPAAYCVPCLATPPHTPPESLSSLSTGYSTPSPSNTFSTLTLSNTSLSTSSTSTLTCRGHFNDFSCALEREILWQGTLFVTAAHVCFYGKYFRKTVRITIDYNDLVSIDREKKMGVFPSSIRLRVRVPAKGHDSDRQFKDYVLTSLISREQAFAEIERNWTAHRYMMKSLLRRTSISPRDTRFDDIIDNDEDRVPTTSGQDEKMASIGRRMRDIRLLAPRSYSVISDDAFSSIENIDQAGFQESQLPPNQKTEALPIVEPRTTKVPLEVGEGPPGLSALMNEGRRGSVASVASSSERQDGNRLFGYLQRKHSSLCRGKSSTVASDQQETHPDNVVEQQEVIALSSGELDLSSDNMSTSSLTTSSVRSESHSASTPSSTLISRSLTTTKVSQKLATSEPVLVHASQLAVEQPPIAIKSPSQQNCLPPFSTQHETQHVDIEPSTTHLLPTPPSSLPVNLPTKPVSCGCSRHYKHAVVSRIISLPLQLCFELLFSGFGAGQGDSLCCDTHRCKDGSTDIKITPWKAPHTSSSENTNATGRKWTSETRQLEYSVSFKVPMLAKTSTACYEVQQVTEYSDYVILVHSESRTPNVPYGEHFSTVNQICMTWEAPGKTRIQCFTEVKFKKSIMWSGKVEAGSLEGSGGFYKEFIGQLAEIAESPHGSALRERASRSTDDAMPSHQRGHEHGLALNHASATRGENTEMQMTSAGTNPGPPLSCPTQSSLPESKPAKPAQVFVTSHTEAPEMSRAQSLLSQQLLLGQPQLTPTPTPSKAEVRLSLDSACRPNIESRPTAESSLQAAYQPKLEKKSSMATLIHSLAAPVLPMIQPPGSKQLSDRNPLTDSSTSMPSQDKASNSSPLPQPSSFVSFTPAAPLSWMRIAKKYLPAVVGGSTCSLDGEAEKMDLATSSPYLPKNEVHVTGVRNSEPRVTFATTVHHARQTSIDGCNSSPQDHTERSLTDGTLTDKAETLSTKRPWVPRPLLHFLVIGIAITALNVWQLFGVVSSMLDVVQLKSEHIHRSFHSTGHPSFSALVPAPPSMAWDSTADKRFQRYNHCTEPALPRTCKQGRAAHSAEEFHPTSSHSSQSDHGSSIPLLQQQTDSLRAEIVELFERLEAARQKLKTV
ncbi:hypothetical protein BGZ94_008403 [Podila epigama]|nr:hypothetical protein BGZ94_008403 [Podila epigama]